MLIRWLRQIVRPAQKRSVSILSTELKRKQGVSVNMDYMKYVDSVNSQLPLRITRPASRMSLRTGVIGYKQGMTNFWDKWGVNIPCTVIQVFLLFAS